jgi:hypothetical protein
MTTGIGVYAAISACSAILMREGIAKSRTASMGKGGNYAFRGIDEFMNACAPAMHETGLIMVPRVLDEKREEREKQGNGYTSVTFYTRVTMEFEFAAVSDGSTVIARTIGEAMDSGDKATNKAMSAALKYALMQTFMIPTSGIADSDEENHEGVRPRAKPLDLSGVTNPWGPTKDALKAKLEAATTTGAIDELRASDEWTGFVKGVDVPAGWPEALVDLARKRWREVA